LVLYQNSNGCREMKYENANKKAGKLVLCLLLFVSLCVSGQGIKTEFGKNILQYKDFDWYFYHTENFDVYFYSGGKELAQYTITQGNTFLKDIETRLDYPLGERITFIIYNSYNDFRQSNFNVPDQEETNPAGKTKTLKTNSFIYFDGSHFDFASQIREGIARIIMNEIMYGGNLQERVQSNVLLNAPQWYLEGLIEYIGVDWNAEYENRLKAGIESERFKKFKKLTDEEQQLIGHSMWKYINDEYGETSVSNIIYIMRANKSIETGYLFVLGKTFNEVYDDWYNYEYKRLSKKRGTPPEGKEAEKLHATFKKGIVTQWDISSKGDYAGVVTNDIGKVRVWVVDLKTGKKTIIYKEGYRRKGIFDYGYPLIGWNPRQNVLTVIYEKKSQPFYIHYNPEEKIIRKRKSDPQVIPNIERVLKFEYADNGHGAVFSAVHKGQSDIFTFDFRTQALRPLTDDIYDDLDPHFVQGSKGIVFHSNRPSVATFRVGAASQYIFNSNFDIFYFPNYTTNRYKLLRLSESPANETSAMNYDSTWFSYLTDVNGVVNRDAVRLDSFFDYIRVIATYKDSAHGNDTLYFFKNDKSTIQLGKIPKDTNLIKLDTAFIYKDTLYTYPLTNHENNIEGYKINHKLNTIYELYRINNRYSLYSLPIPKNIPASAVPRDKTPSYPRGHQPSTEIKTEQTGIEPRILKNTTDTIHQLVKRNNQPTGGADSIKNKPKQYYFQTDFPVPENVKITGNENEIGSQKTGISLLYPKRNTGYYKFPSPSPYFLSFSFDAVTAQLDEGIITSPYLPYTPGDNSFITPAINGLIKMGVTDMFKDYRIIGGFSILGNLRGAQYFLTYDNFKDRLDKKITFFRSGETKDYDGTSFYKVTSDELRMQLKYPFNETSAIKGDIFGRLDRTVFLTGEMATLKMADVNKIWSGGKLEYVFDNTINIGQNIYYGTRAKAYTEFYDQVNNRKTWFQVFGTDIRTYVKISRQIIWANRFAAAASVGTAKVVYFMGGVDDWLFPVFNQNNLVDPTQNYVYKALATPLRGFDQNVRNGSAYAVFNSELRVPIIKYLINHPIRSNLLENLQVVGFVDAGSAWNGFNPFSEENAYNKTIYNQVPFKITVTSLRDPFVIGYGWGLRTVLLGYYLKLDWAWGIQDGVTGPQKTYLSLGYDF
jgi:hypothetical protein